MQERRGERGFAVRRDALKAHESEVWHSRCKQDKEREENLKELTKA